MRFTIRLLVIVLSFVFLYSNSSIAQDPPPPDPNALWNIVKVGSPVAEAGGPMVYSIYVDAFTPCLTAIPFFACDATITDTLPMGFEFIEADITANLFSPFNGDVTPINCTKTGQDIECMIGNMDGGDFVVVNVPGIADPGLTPGTMLDNTAVLNVVGSTLLTGPFNIMFDSTFSTEITVDAPQADLVIFKTDIPDPVVLGNNVEYTVTVLNRGPQPATGVEVLENLPLGTTVSPQPGNCTIPDGMNRMTCTLPDIPVGETRDFTVTIDTTNLPELNEQVILNIASVSSNELDPDPGSNTVGEPTLVEAAPPPPPNQANLVLTKTSPTFALQSFPPVDGPEVFPFFYSIFVINEGPSDAFGVNIQDFLPAGTSLAPPGGFNPLITVPSGSTGNCMTGPPFSNFSCTVDILPVGEMVRIDAQVIFVGGPPFPFDLLFQPYPIFNVATVSIPPIGFDPETRMRVRQIDPIPSDNTDTRVTRIINPPEVIETDLVITKNCPDVVIMGEEYLCDIEVVNLGPDEATDVVIRDIIPAATDLDVDMIRKTNDVTCSEETNPDSGRDELICTVPSIPNGGIKRMRLPFTYFGMVPALPDSLPVFNIATVGFDLPFIPEDDPVIVDPQIEFDGPIQYDPETANNTDVFVSDVIQPPPAFRFVDLVVDKIDSPDPVVFIPDMENPDYPSKVTYEINVWNFGPQRAFGVRIEDRIPNGMFLDVDDIALLPLGCNYLPGPNLVRCQIGQLGPAGDRAIVRIRATLEDPLPFDLPKMVLNAVKVEVPPFIPILNEIQLDVAPSNNTATEKTTILPEPPPMSDLLIIKTDTPDPVIENGFLTYTLFVKNLGPDTAYGVIVSDWLPLFGISLDPNDIMITTSENVDPEDCDIGVVEDNRIICEIESLAVEESATITIKVLTLPLDEVEFLTIFNLAKVSSEGIVCEPEEIDLEICEPRPASADKNLLNNVTVESTLIGPFVPMADVFVIKSDSPDPVIVNSPLTYSLFVSNAGPHPATDVVVVDTLPSSVNYVSDTGNCVLVGDELTCQIGNLAVGEFVQVLVTVTPQVPGSILNVAQVEAMEHDPKFANNTSTELTTVNQRPTAPPDDPPGASGNDMFILKFAAPNPVELGEEVLFTLIVGNNGEFASSVTVVDNLPSGLTFVSATSSSGDECNLVDGDVRCEIANVPALGDGETVVIEIRAVANQAGALPNVAVLEDNPNDPNPTNDVSIVALEVVSQGSQPQPQPQPDPGDGDDDPPTTGGSNDGGSNGCTLADSPVNSSNMAFNFAILLMPLLVFGIRSLKRKK